MGRIQRLVEILFFGGLLMLVSCADQAADEIDLLDVCPRTIMNNDIIESCAIDLFLLPAFSESLCGSRILTFGYLDKIHDNFILFPDKNRARADFLESSLVVDTSHISDEFHNNDVRSYVQISGIYHCRDSFNDLTALGFGEILADKLWIFQGVKEKGRKEKGVRENILNGKEEGVIK